LTGNDFPLGWAVSFAEIERELLACTSSTDACAVIVATAVALVPGAQYASVTGLDRGRFQTRASSAQLANALDAIQYVAGSGPCLEAVKTASNVRVDDLASDERWPAFSTEAVATTPVRAMLSVSLVGDREDQSGYGLNLYATDAGAFDDYSEAIAGVLSGQGAIAIVATEARAHADQLEQALANSREIGIAMGVLMRSHSITRDAAFDLLRAASQQTHRKLADIARDVAETGTIDSL
jgi:hypothetical protein